MAKIKKVLNLIKSNILIEDLILMNIQGINRKIKILNCNLNRGLELKIKILPKTGVILVFPKSFNASKRDCKRPRNLNFIGPNRIWNLPIIF